MAILHEQVSLQPFNTFGVAVQARKLYHIRASEDLQDLLATDPGPFFVLGGGSNVLWIHEPDQIILKNEIPGIAIEQETDRWARVGVGAGVIWQDLVVWSLQHNLGGLENLSLIPGTVGAAPIQNIGAYGVELEQLFHSLEATSLESGRTVHFAHSDCQFGYRNSVFKRALKGKYIITKVRLILRKPPHQLQLQYGALKTTLSEMAGAQATIQDVSKAVIQIRQSKLPDPSTLGNAGSFFKNPELEKRAFERLQKAYPKIPYYPLPDGKVKVPAGWLIDQAGWKGKRIGQVGCYAKQALVIVNYGGASGAEVWDFAQRVRASVQAKFQIMLQPEVNCL